MARLPDANSLGPSPTPRSQRRLAADTVSAAKASAAQREGAAAQAVARAEQGVGEAVAQSGRDRQRDAQVMFASAEHLQAIADQRKEREDRRRLMRAKAGLLREQIAAEAALEDDPDYETLAPRYLERVGKVRAKLAESISDEFMREQFELESAVDIDRGSARMLGKSRDREREVSAGALNKSLGELLEAAALAKNDEQRQRVVMAAHDLIATEEVNRTITPAQAEALRKAWSADYARARYDSLSLGEQVLALKDAKRGGTWLNYMPAKERAANQKVADKALEVEAKKAQAEREQYAAQSAADSAVRENPGDYGAQVAVANKIKNPKVREEVLRRIDNNRIRENRVEQEKSEALYMDLRGRVSDGTSVDDLQKELVPLSASQVEGLRHLERVLTKGKVEQDERDAIMFSDEVTTAVAKDPKAIFNWSLEELEKRLPPGDMRRVIDLRASIKGAEGKITAIPAARQQINTLVSDTLNAIGLPAKTNSAERSAARALFRERVETYVQSYAEQHDGKEPPLTELNNVVKDLTRKFVFDPPGFDFGNVQKFAFELTGDEELRTVVVPKEVRKQLASMLKQRGVEPSEETIRETYLIHQGLIRANP